jgi:hypothetical protein
MNFHWEFDGWKAWAFMVAVFLAGFALGLIR